MTARSMFITNLLVKQEFEYQSKLPVSTLFLRIVETQLAPTTYHSRYPQGDLKWENSREIALSDGVEEGDKRREGEEGEDT